jgi:hypothetical protein
LGNAVAAAKVPAPAQPFMAKAVVGRAGPCGAKKAMSDIYAHAAAIVLMFAVVPVWIAAGLADYFCHRHSRIAFTSGAGESVLHLVQLSLVGIPVILSLFLEINAGLLALWIICLLLHHAVAFWDVRFANRTRTVGPIEQMVHSFLELTPMMAFALLAVLFWPQLLALLGAGSEKAQWVFAAKRRALPAGYVVAVLAAALLFDALPYLEELLRSLRIRRLEQFGAAAGG